MAADARKLKDEAAKAVSKGKYGKALENYLELEKLSPHDGSWPKRAGDMLRHLKRNEDAIAAWGRAVDKYAQAGFLVKAIAVCKLILRLDAGNAHAKDKLRQLNRERGIATSRPHIKIEVAPVPPARDIPIPRADEFRHGPEPSAPEIEIVLADGAPLEDVPLADVVPGAQKQVDESGNFSGITVIPIEWMEADFAALKQSQDDDRREALERTPLFSDLEPAAFEALIDRCVLVELDKGDALFSQGDPGDTLYVIAHGSVAVIAEGEPRQTITALEEGAFFGEIGLVTNQPRSATIEALEQTHLLAIGRQLAIDLVKEHRQVLVVLLRFLRDRLIDTLVSTSPLFAPYSGPDRQALAGKFEFLEVERDSELITEGLRSAGLFILLTGHADVLRDGSTKIAQLSRGDLFGEMSLLSGDKAVASVRTTTKSLVLRLPSSVFREVIMTHPQVLVFINELADERQQQLDAILAGKAEYRQGKLRLL